MPIHDWTRVNAGIFHHFHSRWVPEISDVLNDGPLPKGYYALVEQVGTLAVLDKPPRVRLVQQSETDVYLKKANRVAIRHSSDDRIIAIIEILSPGNKSSQHAIEEFLDKVWAAIDQGIHLLLVDLFPPTKRDPQGLHTLIWGDAAEPPPPDLPLTLVAYHSISPRNAYVEPTAIGQALIDMPLFLDRGHYVPVPLEATYESAWRGVPQRWKNVITA
jgi:hypothetical protein